MKNPWYCPAILERSCALAQWMGRKRSRNVARWIGRASSRICHSQLALARENLAAVTGATGADLDAMVRRNFNGFLGTMADYAWCAKGGSERLDTCFAPVGGSEHLHAAQAPGRGVLLVTGHLGNWELGAPHLADIGMKLTVVTMEEQTPELTRWRAEYRQRHGVRTVAIGSDRFAFVEIVKALQRGEAVALLVDRPVPDAAERVQMFERPVWFSNGPSALHKITGAPVLPVFMLEQPDGRYQPSALPMVAMDTNATGHYENTQRLADAFEPVIRAHPEQWYQFARVFS